MHVFAYVAVVLFHHKAGTEFWPVHWAAADKFMPRKALSTCSLWCPSTACTARRTNKLRLLSIRWKPYLVHAGASFSLRFIFGFLYEHMVLWENHGKYGQHAKSSLALKHYQRPKTMFCVEGSAISWLDLVTALKMTQRETKHERTRLGLQNLWFAGVCNKQYCGPKRCRFFLAGPCLAQCLHCPGGSPSVSCKR